MHSKGPTVGIPKALVLAWYEEIPANATSLFIGFVYYICLQLNADDFDCLGNSSENEK